MTTKDEALKLALELKNSASAYWTEKEILIIEKLIKLLALAEQPAPPPECQTEAEKTAFAFGWWKALESVRQQTAQQQAAFTIYDSKGTVVVHLDAKPAPATELREQEPEYAWPTVADYEREACAKLCDEYQNPFEGRAMADAIRARKTP